MKEPVNTIAANVDDEPVEAVEIEEAASNSDAVDASDDSEVDTEEDEEQDFFTLDDDELPEETDENSQEETTDALQNEEGNEESNSDADVSDEEVGAEEEKVTAPASSDESAFYDQVTEAAILRVKEITGQEFDEFDTKHKVILMREAEKIAKVFESKSNATSEVIKIVNDCGGKKFQDYLADKNDNLTVKQQRSMLEAEAKGDFSLTLAFMKKTAEEFKHGDKAKAKAKALNAGATVQPSATRATPPRTIGSGTGAKPVRHEESNMLGLDDLGIDS